jgi:hypothetical protein
VPEVVQMVEAIVHTHLELFASPLLHPHVTQAALPAHPIHLANCEIHPHPHPHPLEMIYNIASSVECCPPSLSLTRPHTYSMDEFHSQHTLPISPPPPGSTEEELAEVVTAAVKDKQTSGQGRAVAWDGQTMGGPALRTQVAAIQVCECCVLFESEETKEV